MYHLLQSTTGARSLLVASSPSQDQHIVVLETWLARSAIMLVEEPDMQTPGWYCTRDGNAPDAWVVSIVAPYPQWEGDGVAPNYLKKAFTLEFLQEVDL